MRKSVPITEVRRNFGIFHAIAQDAPVPVSKHGQESVYIVSADTFRQMVQQLQLAGLCTDALRPSPCLTPPLS